MAKVTSLFMDYDGVLLLSSVLHNALVDAGVLDEEKVDLPADWLRQIEPTYHRLAESLEKERQVVPDVEH